MLSAPKIVFRHTQVHYIYSILFEPHDPVAIVEEARQKSSHNPFRNILEPFEQLSQDARLFRYYEFSFPSNGDGNTVRDYLEPYLHLPMPQIEGCIYSIPEGAFRLQRFANGAYNDEPSYRVGMISAHYHLFGSGRGTLRYTLDVQSLDGEGADVPSLVEFCNLGLRRGDERDNSTPACPFRLLNHSENEWTLFRTFRRDSSNLADLFSIREANPSVVDGRPPSQVYEQDPYPVVVAQTDHASFETLSLHPPNEQTQELHRELLTLLFRSREFGAPDETFAADHLDYQERLPNLCSTQRVFLQFYIRSALAITENQGNDPTSNGSRDYIIPAFLQTTESLRTRWHACAILNQWVEQAVREVTAALKNYNYGELLSIVDRSARLRALIAAGLTDPVTYRFGSGSMTKLYANGLHTLRIREGEELLIARLEILDKLLQDAMYLTRRRELTAQHGLDQR